MALREACATHGGHARIPLFSKIAHLDADDDDAWAEYKAHAAAALLQALNIEKMKYVELHEKGEISDRAASRLELLMSRLQVQLMSLRGAKPGPDEL
ncbi:MAG: hypothetical protein VX017_10425, partial [Pseudomonadota bacterium]|nr:hypothetical protein [Pseudomonadota bacterium]